MLPKKLGKKPEKKSKKENKEKPELSKKDKIRPRKVSWIVFFFSISMVIISLIPIVFPAGIVTWFTQVNDLDQFDFIVPERDPFQTGPLAGALFTTSGIVFTLAVLYFKNKLPDVISKIFEFIFNFEVSKKVALIFMIIILAIYVAASANELVEEENFEDYIDVKKRLETWSPDQITNSFEPHVRYFFITLSMILFGNYMIIPFLASIALVIMTYFFTKQITNKRFSGLVAMVILLQSNVFLIFDTTVAYTNFWILFYLISLYFVYKAWPLTPVSYILSIPSKALTIMFLPMSLYFLLRSPISRNKKIMIGGSLIAVIALGIIYSSTSGNVGGVVQEGFIVEEFWVGFASFATEMRFDGLVIVFLMPLMVGLLFASKKNKHAESMMVMIGGMLLIAPLLTGFSDQTNQPYRFVPLVVFFAVGVGILLSKTKN